MKRKYERKEVDGMTNEEKIELIRKGEYSIDEFLKENQPFCYKVLGEFLASHPNATCICDELKSAALAGLWKACRDFKHELGNAFSTVAWTYCYREIQLTYRNFCSYREKTVIALDDSVLERESKSESILHELIDLNMEDLKLTKKQELYFSRYLELHSLTEVAKEFNTSRQAVRQVILPVQKKLRERYLENNKKIHR